MRNQSEKLEYIAELIRSAPEWISRESTRRASELSSE